MKTILFFFIAIFFCSTAHSQTPIPGGPISGTWTLAGSPYLIQDSTIILNDSTLIIEPGVMVEWQGSYTMHVQGQLLAEGTEADSIIFTAADPDTGFQSIRFLGTPLGNDTSRFKYCIFRHGRVYGEYADNCGGAIAAINYSKFIVDHCLFDDNKATEVNIEEPGGGAIALWTSSPVIRNSKFINNISHGGGAICCWIESNPIIENNLFTGNTATGFGGAIFCYSSDPTIHHNLFYDNTSLIYGGAISLYLNCEPYIINNTIANNLADYVGGGIDIFLESHPQILNNILWGNTAENGNQVCISTNDCKPDFFYCDIQGGKDSIGGIVADTLVYEFCIDTIPMFEDPSTGDYHLMVNSPCINTGVPTIFDPDGTVSDIGAYYFDHRQITASDASDITNNSFIANWQAATDATGYLLDVAYDENFTNFVDGYPNLDVGNTLFYLVEGLDPSTTYYYRIRAKYFWGRSGYSDSIIAETTPHVNIDENYVNESNLITIYPNPVNEISNIEYRISNIKYVKLSVIDIHGKVIISLVNETQSAGVYIARFDASDLPSSIYLIHLQVDDQIVAKKIIK